MSRLFYQQQYEGIRSDILNDRSCLDDSSRLVVFMEQYVTLMKDESAILEWEKDVWAKGFRLMLLIMSSMLFSFSIFIYLDNKDGGIIFGSLSVTTMLYLSFLTCYPKNVNDFI